MNEPQPNLKQTAPSPLPDFRAWFEAAPSALAVLSPDLTIVAANDAYLKATMTRHDEIVGRNLFDVFPVNPGDAGATGMRNARDSIERVLRDKVADSLVVLKYDIPRPDSEGGGFEERFWSVVFSPVFGPDKEITHVMIRAENVTDFVKLKSLRSEQEKRNQELERRGEALEAEVFVRAQEVHAANERLRRLNEELSSANHDLLAAHQQADRVFAAYAKALPGSLLDGKYRLDKELGVGGFGVVFQGWHLTLDCPIAVKVFRPVPGNDSARDLERFLREGAAAVRLNHPNAVQVMDSGVSGEGVAFLVMELLQGRTLGQELGFRGPFSLRRCAQIAARVADVLAVAHFHGILHRDIKPENIFLNQTGHGEVVKVVDFGLAKFFGDHPGAAPKGELTRTGEFMGTPSFIAPERVAGVYDDVRSDVFSLGTVLYKMICGVPPWTRQERLEAILGAGGEKPPRPMELFRRRIPSELESLVRQSLAWDRTQRPSAQEFAADLERLAPKLDDGPAALTKIPSAQEVEEATEIGNSPMVTNG